MDTVASATDPNGWPAAGAASDGAGAWPLQPVVEVDIHT